MQSDGQYGHSRPILLLLSASLLLFVVLALLFRPYGHQTAPRLTGNAIIEEEQVPQNELLPGVQTIYIYGKGLIASKKDTAVTYYQHDHLGSAWVATNDKAQLSSLNKVYPYGQTLRKESYSETGARYDFTGKEDDGRLSYFGARYYDSLIGRFIATDPIHSTESPYAYVHGNPLAFLDTTGKAVIPSFFIYMGTTVGHFKMMFNDFKSSGTSPVDRLNDWSVSRNPNLMTEGLHEFHLSDTIIDNAVESAVIGPASYELFGDLGEPMTTTLEEHQRTMILRYPADRLNLPKYPIPERMSLDEVAKIEVLSPNEMPALLDGSVETRTWAKDRIKSLVKGGYWENIKSIGGIVGLTCLGLCAYDVANSYAHGNTENAAGTVAMLDLSLIPYVGPVIASLVHPSALNADENQLLADRNFVGPRQPENKKSE